MGLKKAFAKQREQELALAKQLPLEEVLSMEIEYDREPWLERENIDLEAKLEKANRDLDIQRKMTKNYARRNQIARAKLKKSLAKIQTLKEEKDQEKLGILAEASLQASQTP